MLAQALARVGESLGFLFWWGPVNVREVAFDAVFLLGAGLVALGLGLIYLPLAPICVGLTVCALVVLGR